MLRETRATGFSGVPYHYAALMDRSTFLTAELPDPTVADFGIAKVQHLSWKAVLDFYTCTECGRCSDNCPAHKTGKILSPKHLTLALLTNPYHPDGLATDLDQALR